LQQQRRLADAGVAADQRHPARHQAAAEHAVELADVGGDARFLASLHLVQHLHLTGRRQRGEARLGRFSDGLDQRIPGVARRALPLPLGGLPAAFGAGINSLGFGHVAA